MNLSTAATLSRINERFYSRYEEAFSATRSRPWPGWNRAIVPFIRHREGISKARVASILDLGCGNGRFGVYLDSVQGVSGLYLGIDGSAAMIRLARRNLAACESLEAGFSIHDLIEPLGAAELGDREFDLIVVFGLLHHLPGFERRRRLLLELAGILVRGGFLALSFWQFGGRSRFQRRILSWSDHNRVSEDEVDENELEDGDFLLGWGNTNDRVAPEEDSLGARRYCHYADPEEARALIDSLGLRTVDRFESDGGPGDLNLYFTLQTDP